MILKNASKTVRERLIRYQQDELTSAVVYARMASREKDQNRSVLLRMAAEEKRHAATFRQYSGVDVTHSRIRAAWYAFLSWLLGFTFVVQIMEKGETLTAGDYHSLVDEIPEMRTIILEEEQHEAELHAMLDEERLHYVGAMVLGLNDALVELTGTIAGLTFALQDNRIVAMAGIITGVSATLSMAASNYLAERADGKDDAFRSSLYTGVAYLVTVVLLVLPYLVLPDDRYLAALVSMLAVVVCIIFFFNYYIAVARQTPFWPRFFEMAGISLGVAVISFAIGLLAKHLLQIDL